MNSSAKLLVVFLVVLAAGAGAFFLMDDGSGADPTYQPDAVKEQPTDPRDKGGATMKGTTKTDPADGGIKREVAQPTRQRRPEEYAQGVKGRILDEQGNPVRNAEVFLLKAAPMNLLALLQAQQRGIADQPLAQVKTDNSGNFMLGVGNPEETPACQLQVLHAKFVDHTVPRITIQPGVWYPHNVTMRRGAALTGRVTAAGSGAAIADAIVTVQTGGFPAGGVVPGREEGIQVTTDQTGFYRIDNAPPGMVNVAAVAVGFARVEKQNTTVKPEVENPLSFELPAGLTISGLVIDGNGDPLSNARVEANSLSTKAAASGRTLTNREGRFEVIGLLEGPYMISADARDHVRAEKAGVKAGDRDVQIVLEKQGGARLRVSDSSGRRMASFHVAVKPYLRAQDDYGQPVMAPRKARHGAEGYYEVSGLDPGEYAFQIEARGHAMAFSRPFKVELATDPDTVDVRMTKGGTIEGQILTAAGKPLAGATIATQPDGHVHVPIFANLVQFKVTRKHATSDAQGRYRLDLLTPGDYQLKITHEKFFDVWVRKLRIVNDGVVNVPPQRMEPGTLVHGMVRIDGKPGVQCKVSISSVADANHNPEEPVAPENMFSCETMTNEKGQFTLPKRVPPGKFKIMAMRQTAENPLVALFQRAEQDVTIGRGQPKYFVQLQIKQN